MLKTLYQPYKWLVVPVLFALFTLTLFIPCVVLCAFNPSWGSRFAARPWARLNIWFTPATVRVLHGERYQRDQSYIVVANHMSQYDIFALYGWLDLDLKWVMKKELRKVPIIGYACELMGHIFIDRKNRDAAVKALQQAKRNFRKGTSVLFFPEGTRSQDGRMLPFKKGAFVMARDLDLPILPITIIGTEKIMPSNTFDICPGHAQLIIHEPIPVEQVRAFSSDQLMAIAQQRIAGALTPELSPLPGIAAAEP
jgi:1-acyl-sn-glycerol-3-phosphate acyltransferase